MRLAAGLALAALLAGETAALELSGRAGPRARSLAPVAAPAAAAARAPLAAPLPVARGALDPEARAVAELCRLIEREAEANGLPPDFFARLIWQESRFDPGAVSPAGAQGIAQFMPGTAALRGLKNPFEVEAAIPASAAYLAELRGRFGNLGLAAAAYNAGEDRVARWLAGRARLPAETQDYVRIITDRPAAWFLGEGREAAPWPLAEAGFAAGCTALPVMRTRAAPRPPWGVTVAAGRSRAAALSAYGRIEARVARLAPGARRWVAPRGRRRTGPRYLVQLGAPSLGQAIALCQRLRASGIACVLARN
ncbi:MAG: lytic transglycosylase domain-containing protein [Pseudomonadota bacterium]